MKTLFLFLVFAVVVGASQLGAQSSAEAASRVWIAEFTASRPEAAAPMARLPAFIVQPTLDISTTRQVSLPFSAQTKYIRVVCEVQCAIRNNGTVTPSDILLPALRPEYFGVPPGSLISVTAVP